jgi:heat shock protein HtpX
MDFRQQISRNRALSGVLVFGFVLLLALMGYVIGFFFFGSPSFGLGIAIVISIIYALIGYYAGSNMALSSVGAIEITPETSDHKHKQVYNIVDEVRLAAGVPMPRVWVIPTNALNAFATGIKPEKGHVAFTEGLLTTLNREELKGVAAHELAHIKNYDIRLMLLASVLAGAIVMIAEIGFRASLFGGSGNNRNGNSAILMFFIGLAFSILAVILAQLAKMALSRKREYLADATAIEFTRYPEGLASALEKIAGDTTQLRGASSLTSEMFIKDPVKKNFMHSLFATHPPIDDRIARLRNR